MSELAKCPLCGRHGDAPSFGEVRLKVATVTDTYVVLTTEDGKHVATWPRVLDSAGVPRDRVPDVGQQVWLALSGYPVGRPPPKAGV